MLHLKQNNEAGMAMVIALMVTLLGSILAASYMNVVIHESKRAVWQKHRAQSLFLAEAGIEKALYYLNNTDDPDNPWVDEYGQLLPTPLDHTGDLAEGNYQVSLHDPIDQPWLPADSYLVKSAGTIDRPRSKDVEHDLSCVAAKLAEIPIPAALGILDAADPLDELFKFQSAVWTIDGRDHKLDGDLVWPPGGKPGIAVANDDINPLTGEYIDDIAHQLDKFPDKPHRLDQVKGWDETGELIGTDAIHRDLTLPTDLDAYANYFRKIAVDISGPDLMIDDAIVGTADQYQVLRADLSQGDKKLSGTAVGHGVLLLEGNGTFEMSGNSIWNGVIICSGNSNILLKGGGNTPAHINGALLISDGFVEMNGTADLFYSSATISDCNAKLLLFQVYSWCGGWGIPLGSEEG